MSETGAAALSSGSRAVETATRALIDILKLLVEAKERRLRAQLNKEHLKQARENREYSNMQGLVNADDLRHIAERKHTRVIAAEMKISERNLADLKTLAEDRGFSFAAIGDKSRAKEINELKEKKEYLESKGSHIKSEISDLRRQRREYISEVEKNGKTLSDDALKGIDKKIADLNKQYANQEYLNAEDRAEYEAVNKKLYGDPANGTKGLTQLNEEMTVMILESDLPLVYNCIKELQDKVMRENVANAIDALKAKEAAEGLTDEEKAKLNALQNKESDLLNQTALEHNGATKQEVFDNMFEALSKRNVDRSGTAYNLQSALNRFVESESVGNGKPIYVVNPKNPESYIKVSKEYDENTQRVVHTYDVYKDGAEQTASQKFGTDGIYTDRNSKYPNGKPRFIDREGNDVDEGGVMYWTALRGEMAELTGTKDENVFVFTSEEMLNEYQTAYKEAKEEQEKQLAENEYDITENLDISPEEVESFKDAVTSTQFFNTDSLTEDCKEELDKQGYYYTSGALGKNGFVTNRKNGEKTTFDELRNKLKENPNDKTAAILACNMRKIQVYTQLAAVQTDIYTKSGNINDEKTAADMRALSLRHEKLTNEIRACDDRLNVYLSEDKSREAVEKDMPNKTELSHGEEFENGEVQQLSLEQVKADADREQAEYAATAKSAALNNERNIAQKSRSDSNIGDRD